MTDLHLFDPSRAPFRWETLSRPAGEYSGDYAEVFPLPPSSMVALLSSSSEPGATGAMWMMMTRSVYRLAAMSGNVPSEVLLAVHRLLHRDAPGVRESAACVRVDFPERRMRYVRAGQVGAFLLRKQSRLAMPFMGMEAGLGEAGAEREILNREVGCGPGDLLVLCGSDTLRIANAGGERFDAQTLCKTIEAAPRSASEVAAALDQQIQRLAGGAAPGHDVSVLVVELREPGQAKT